MENKSYILSKRIKFLEKLKPLLKDPDVYGRVYANLYDLMEASDWLLSEIDNKKLEISDIDSLEDFLIDLDVHYIQHAIFHLNSLGADVSAILDQLADENE